MSREKSRIFYMAVGQRIKKLREGLSLTQAGFGKRLDNAPWYKVRDIESGKVGSDKLYREIAYTFGANLRWILEGEGEMFLDQQTKANLLTMAVNQGVLTTAEVEMLNILRQCGLDTPEKLEASLNKEELTRSLQLAIADAVGKYTTGKATRKSKR